MALEKTVGRGGSVLHTRGGNNAAHATMREFNGLCARVRAVRDCTRLRNRVSTRSGTPLSLNGMHIYGVTVPGCTRYRCSRGASDRERESEEKVENWREKEGGGERERERKRLPQQRPRRVWLRRQALQISMAHFVLRLPAHAF